MAATVTGIHLGPDTHANRPAASAPPVGAFYYCSDHDLIYITDGSSWTTWADNSTSGGSVATDAIFDAKGDLAVGTGSDTAARLAVGTNDHVLTADSGEATGLKWAAAGGSSISDYLYTAPGGEDAVSVEWAGSDLAGFTQLDETGEDGHVTWTEAAGMLSLHHDGSDGVAEFHAVVKSIGALSYPASFVTALRFHGPQATQHTYAGIVLADGAVHGSGKQIIAFGNQTSGTSGFTPGLRETTGYDTSVDVATGDDRPLTSPTYIRLRWTAANTFFIDTSPDGISWIQAATNSATITPTHMGLVYSAYNNDNEAILTYHFLRAYDDS